MPLLGLILLVVSFFAAKSVPGARKWAGIVFGLIVLQVALALFAFSVPALGALHGINALAVFGTAVRASMLTREAGRRPRERHGGAVDVPRQSVRLVGAGGVAPCQLTPSAAAGGYSSRRSSPSSLLGGLGWYWFASLVPSTYSVMDMGHVDYGGGPAHEHGADAQRRRPDRPGRRASRTSRSTWRPARSPSTWSAVSGSQGYTLNGTSPGPEIRGAPGRPGRR